MVLDIKRLLQLIATAEGPSDTIIDDFYAFSVISTEILHVRAALWAKRKLGKAPNVSKCTFCHVIMSGVDIGGCSGQAPPTRVLQNHFKLGQHSDFEGFYMRDQKKVDNFQNLISQFMLV